MVFAVVKTELPDAILLPMMVTYQKRFTEETVQQILLKTSADNLLLPGQDSSEHSLFLSQSKGQSRHCKCELCGKVLSGPEKLKYHLLVHTGEKPLECKVCKKRFRAQATLQTHMRVHTGEKPYSCTVCGQHFSQHSNLKYHKISKHMAQKPHTCPLCGRSFILRTDLDRHINTHMKIKPFGCTLCEQTFARKDHVIKHMRKAHIEELDTKM